MRARLLTVVSLQASLGGVRLAAAEEHTIRWSIVAQPDGCDGQRLARATELACDALGHACVVVHDGAATDRRATLRCATASPREGAGPHPPETPWTLDVYDGAGVLRWTLAVEGDDEGVHRAAILIARTELDVPPEAAPAATHDTATPIVPVVMAPARANDATRAPLERPVASPATPAPWGLFGAARATTSSGFGPAVGGSAGAAFVVWRELAFGFDLGGEHGLQAKAGYEYSAVRLGANAGYGAPWGASRFGVAIEGGALLGDVTAPASLSPASQQFLHAYARATGILQWDGRRALRPFAALSIAASTAPVQVTSGGSAVTTIPSFAASLDVGLAWRSQ